ncbi:LysM peptidoglycan-binding domain-containing protein [Arthrobacter sp. 92]|uniref:LysM peptidoglycan-binding domain-containing protein n=1 Tax=Arthrobacter sp. 92 TaxID=3418175 RepID=UPI003CFCC92C
MDQNQHTNQDTSHDETAIIPAVAKASGNPHRFRTILAGAAVAAAVAVTTVTAVSYSNAATSHVSDVQPAAATTPGPAAAASASASASPAGAPGEPKAEAAVAAAPAPAPPQPSPAAPPVPAPEPAAPAPSNTYTVVAGDTVGSIAARFGVDMNAMLAANGLGAYAIIVPGQVLNLTGPAIAVAADPAAAAPAAAAPAAPVAAAAPAPAPAPSVRTIYVAGSGGQAMVDSCIGPIHFTPNDGYSLFITEHDFCGGWARFSGISVGETVSIPGYGTYTVTGRGQVPNPGTTDNVIAVFGGFPRAILQTCIPGTSQMLLIALN